MLEDRVKFLEKQNAALIKTLSSKLDDNVMLKMIIEQQNQILSMNAKIGQLVERDKLRERQTRFLYNLVKNP